MNATVNGRPMASAIPKGSVGIPEGAAGAAVPAPSAGAAAGVSADPFRALPESSCAIDWQVISNATATIAMTRIRVVTEDRSLDFSVLTG